MISHQADKVTRRVCFACGISNLAVSNLWFMFSVQTRRWLRGLVAACGSGANGRFIYHRCHSPPERKSALPNWNIAEFTLLIRAPCTALPEATSTLQHPASPEATWHLMSGWMFLHWQKQRSHFRRRTSAGRYQSTIKHVSLYLYEYNMIYFKPLPVLH